MIHVAVALRVFRRAIKIIGEECDHGVDRSEIRRMYSSRQHRQEIIGSSQTPKFQGKNRTLKWRPFFFSLLSPV